MDTKPTSLLRRVRVNGRNYFVVPHHTKTDEHQCKGCARHISNDDDTTPCGDFLKGMADQDKCGLAPVIYIHATQESLAAYTADRLE